MTARLKEMIRAPRHFTPGAMATALDTVVAERDAQAEPHKPAVAIWQNAGILPPYETSSVRKRHHY